MMNVHIKILLFLPFFLSILSTKLIAEEILEDSQPKVLKLHIDAQSTENQEYDLNGEKSPSETIENYELIVIPETNIQNEFLRFWLEQIPDIPQASTDRVLESIASLPSDIILQSSSALKSRLENWAIKNWNSASECQLNDPLEQSRSIKTLTNTLPQILLKTLLSQSSKRVNSGAKLKDMTLTIADLFIPKTKLYLSDQEKIITMGTAMLGGGIIGSAYLINNNINFRQNIDLPMIKSENFKLVRIKIGGENIGFSSNNPYFELGTTIQLRNDLSVSFLGGLSNVKKNEKTGKQTAFFSISIPTVNSDSSKQKLTLRAGVSAIHLGPAKDHDYIAGQYNGGVSYSFSPILKRIGLLNPSRLSLNFSINPLDFSNSLILNSENGTHQNFDVKSTVNANLGYKFNTGKDYSGSLGVSIVGGARYDENGGTSPYFGAFFNLELMPRNKRNKR